MIGPESGRRFEIGDPGCPDGGNSVGGHLTVVDNKVKVRTFDQCRGF